VNDEKHFEQMYGFMLATILYCINPQLIRQNCCQRYVVNAVFSPLFGQRPVTASVVGLEVHGLIRHISELLNRRIEQTNFPFLLWGCLAEFSVFALIEHCM